MEVALPLPRAAERGVCVGSVGLAVFSSQGAIFRSLSRAGKGNSVHAGANGEYSHDAVPQLLGRRWSDSQLER